jgi:perosamine synthetase
LSLHEALAFLRASIPIGTDPSTVFEDEFSDHCLDGRPVVLAPSARVGLAWVIEALGLGPGDEILTQGFNFSAVPAAIIATGATPRFVDLAPDSFEGDWTRFDELVSNRTRAVVATHLYGNPADLARLRERCDDRGILLIEDCAQGIGATFGRRPVGTWGHGAIFSLGGTKNLTLLGGGAAAVERGDAATTLRRLAERHPRMGLAATVRLAVKAAFLAVATHPLPFSMAVLPGLRFFESRGIDLVHRVMEEPHVLMTGIAQSPRPSRQMAAIGVEQLRRVDRLNRARIRNGWVLRRALERTGDLAPLVVPPMREGSVFMSFPVLHPARHELARALRRRGVDTDFGFMSDCSKLAIFSDVAGDCPNSERVAREILHLPIHPFLRLRHLDRIAAAVRDAVDAA